MQSRRRSVTIGDTSHHKSSLTQEDCMSLSKIIALDLGKFKTVLYRSRTVTP